MRVLVTGASGFVGAPLCQALVTHGCDVVAMTRRPASYRGQGTPVRGDITDRASVRRALQGVEAAYYLIHSLDDPDFERKDAAAASLFAAEAAAAGVDRIIYLGGLGRDDGNLSAHLRSRREVEALLGSTGVPVTVLRAAIIVGHGGISWEITRQLVRRLPAMVAPRWVTTRTQPVALADVIRYLLAVLDLEAARGRIFEVGGPEVLTYAEMMQRVARLHHHRSLPILQLPLLTPRLSSRWLALVTDVNTATGRNLIDSMSNEVVVTDDSILELVPGPRMTYAEAVRQAYADRARAGAA